MADSRLDAFLSLKLPNVFHSVQHSQDVWREDPFDVPEIHAEARAAFDRMVERSAGEDPSGRILLLRGEAGAGKTHLMRAFRSSVHGSSRGLFAYMQMTSSAKAYDRYVLQKLVESLDQPYWPPTQKSSSLKMTSDALLASLPKKAVSRLRDADGGPAAKQAVNELADRLVDRLYLPDLDLDLVRALLFLQVDRPSVKIRVIKYLRAEALSDYDREVLGDMAPRAVDDDAMHVIGQLAAIVQRVLNRGLVVCLDQLEDIFNLDESKERFAAVMDTVKQLGEIPGAVVVLSCLDNFYATLSQGLIQSVKDRVEQDPAPILLTGARTTDEVRLMVGRRLNFLYEECGVTGDAAGLATAPFPSGFIADLKGTAREVLARCQRFREASQLAGKLVPHDDGGRSDSTSRGPDVTPLRQLWNDARSASIDLPEDEAALADLLRHAIRDAATELGAAGAFEPLAHRGKPWIRVRHVKVREPREDLLVAVCDRGTQGGGLKNQLTQLDEGSKDAVPVAVRSTEFPTGKSQTTKFIGKLVAKRNARTVVLQNSDVRHLSAFFRFKEDHGKDPQFEEFLRVERPITSIESMVELLDLHGLELERSPTVVPPPGDSGSTGPDPADQSATTSTPTSASASTPTVALSAPLEIGETLGRAPKAVGLQPDDLKRHITFMGGTGSGKTTAALMVIEKLLDRGVSAVLVDRKGDLCGFADPDVWNVSLDNPELDGFRARLRERVNVQLFTPGNPTGRGLQIPLLPAGTRDMQAFDREMVARVASSALADMMSYGRSQQAQGKRAALQTALQELAAVEDGATLTLESLVGFLQEPEDELVAALGGLHRFLEPLALDLEIMARSKGSLMGMGCEPLSAAQLYGTDATDGRATLSIVSTKFLGSNADVQFWVAQLVMEVGRHFAKHPASELQAILMLDEADLYLPATSSPATKAPVEDLLRRARSMGLSVFLATQSPGDFDYRCRDNIRTWLVGLLTQKTATKKLDDMFAEARSDTSGLASQKVGQFHLLAEGKVQRLQLIRNAVKLPSQVPDERILELAAAGRR